MSGKISQTWRRFSGDLNTLSYRRLAQTHTLSSIGDAFVAVALAGSVFFNQDPNAARSRVALSLLLTILPFALVAPFLGPAVDRLRGGRRVILMSASAARALMCLLMAGAIDSLALFPFAFLCLVFSKTHAVAKSASIPELVKDEHSLVRANSILAVCAIASSFLAGAIAFGVSNFAGGQWVLRVGAIIFTCGAAIAFEVGTGNEHPAIATPRETAIQLKKTGVLLACGVMASLRALVGFLTFDIAFNLRNAGAATWWFGLAVTGAMLGSFSGNILAPRLRGRVREEHILTGAVAVVCITSIVVTFHPTRVANVLLAMCLGACASASKLSFDSLVQRDAPAAVQGRSFARFEALFQFVWVIGALIPVVITIEPATGSIVLAVVSGAVAIWYGISQRRQTEPTQATS